MNTHQDQSRQNNQAKPSWRTARWLGLFCCLTLTLSLCGALWPTAQAMQNARVVRVTNASAAPGLTATLAVELVAQGNENALSFSLTFNPAVLTNPVVTAGNGAAGISLQQNPNQVASGRLGIVVSLPANQSFAAGTRQLVQVAFTLPANAPIGATTIDFGSQPIGREISDPIANELTATYTPGTLTVGALAVSLSAASFSGRDQAAPEMILAMFGTDLATEVRVGETVPLPTTLAGTTVAIRDSAGTVRNAPLFFVSPGQINYLVPAGLANGAATLTVTTSNNKLSVGALNLQAVAPGLFSANANGAGVPAAVLFRQKANGQQSLEELMQAQGGALVPKPIDLGPDGDIVLVVAFGTGIRGRSNAGAVTCTLGGTSIEVPFASAQGGLVGLDQLNLGPLPRSLAGRGNVDLVITVDGKAANTMLLNVK